MNTYIVIGVLSAICLIGIFCLMGKLVFKGIVSCLDDDIPVQKDQEQIQNLIRQVCDDLAEFLIEKNREYGNSALYPVRVFSKVDAIEQINVRMDDKLSRMVTPGKKNIKEDTPKDFVGYWILREVAKRL